MSFFQRLMQYPKHLLSMVHMGYGFWDKIKIAAWYKWFTLLRNIGKTPAFKNPKTVNLKVCGQSAKVYIWHQLDFDLYNDTFVKEEYKLDLAQEPKTIFDLGSNIGSTVVYFAVKYPSAHIYCFEPDPNNVSLLKQNTEPFKDRLTIIEKAVWKESNQKLEFYIVPNRHWSSSLLPREGSSQKIEVDTISLDDAMQQLNIEHIDLLKYDIEGAEYEVFKEFKDINKVSHLIGEVHPKLFSKPIDEFRNLLNGFKISKLDPTSMILSSYN